MEDKEPAYQKRGVPRLLALKGNDLFYKDPPTKENLYIYRCRKKGCKYYVKIDKLNIDKILNKETNISYYEFNSHNDHEAPNEIKLENQENTDFRTEKETKELATSLIKNNINENLEFHYQNFQKNKIKWSKAKISRLVYKIRELKYPKEEEFLNAINLILINLNDIARTKVSKTDVSSSYSTIFCSYKSCLWSVIIDTNCEIEARSSLATSDHH